MKSREFRIGNVVGCDGTPRPLVIQEIYESQITAGFLDEPDYEMDLMYPNLIGIPITEEWLKKAGFGLSTGDKWSLLSPRGCLFSLQNEKFNTAYKVYINFDYTQSRFEYIHQLQNLYFALSGDELVFN